MQTSVTGRHVKVSDEVREHIDTKTEKLQRFYDRIQEVEVVLALEAEQLSAEMIVRLDHKHTLVAKEVGPDAVALIDIVVDKIERQLTKHKEKMRNHKHDGKPDPGETD